LQAQVEIYGDWDYNVFRAEQVIVWVGSQGANGTAPLLHRLLEKRTLKKM